MSEGSWFERSSMAQLTLARIRGFLREPEAVFWTFFFPVIMALGLGFAFRDSTPQDVSVGVLSGPGAQAIAASLEGADGLTVERMAEARAMEALRDGDIAILVVTGDSITYRYDATRPESRVARLAVDDALQRAAGRADARPTRDVLVTAPGSRYIDFLIPGLIGLNLLSTGLWGVGFALVRMRNDNLLKRLVATPMRRSEFLLSFMLGRLAFLALELPVILGFAYLVFDVTVRGSLLALAAIAVLGAFTFTGLGVLIASRARTIEGVSGIMNLTAVPMWLLSGVFFSYQGFPEFMHPIIKALPLTPIVDGIRAVMNDGATLLALSGSLAIAAAWGVATFGAALAIFRWR